ncbi:cellulase family glycosylhydrolase [bacterium]|nr:cellulase family glycosylhydrolase [bacterium]
MKYKICLDSGAPICPQTGNIIISAQHIKEAGANYARINCILGPWKSPDDTEKHGTQKLSWFDTYDKIVDEFLSQGIEVYMLINDEAVHSEAGSINNPGWVDDYVQNVCKIIEHFKDKINVYESFNEPNDWAGGKTAEVEPFYFAKMLEDIYRSVKINNKWDVTLVSGPLLGHDWGTAGCEDAAPYLDCTYLCGINHLGWGKIKEECGSYPLDGIGYHIYNAQDECAPEHVAKQFKKNIDNIWKVVTRYEGESTNKKIWLSEFGWNSGRVSEETQARNLKLGFEYLLADERIDFISYFCLEDFPGDHTGSNNWGVYRQKPLVESNRKPAWTAFKSLTEML